MQIVAPRPTLGGLMTPLELPDLEAWYDLSRPASTTSDDIRISAANLAALIADKSGNSAVNCLCSPGANTTANSATLGAIGALGTSAFTIVVRVAVSSFGGGADVALVGVGNGANSANLIAKNGTSRVQMSKATVGYVSATNGSNLSALTTYTIAYTKSGTTGTYYINGVADGTCTDNFDYTANSGVVIGQFNTGVSGVVYQVRVYSAALDAAGVLADYNGTVQANCVLNVNFALASKLAASFTATTGGTVTINATGDLGARIAGERDLYQFTDGKKPVLLPFTGTKYGYLNGGTSTCFSTPNAAALNTFTAGIDLRFYGAPATSWTPALPSYLINKRLLGYAYRLYLNVDGTLAILWSTNNAAAIAQPSTVTVASALGTSAGWVRATLAFDNGSGNYEVKFYTSSDGSSWTQLGTTVTGAGTTSITAANTDQLDVGAYSNGTQNFVGRINRAQIYDGIDGTLVFDFNPAAYVSGTTFLDSSSNGATITLNGGATIVDRTQIYTDGVDDYMKAPAFALSQPETVYFVGKQVTWTLNDALIDGGSIDSREVFQVGSPNGLRLYAGASVAQNTGLALNTAGVVTAVFNAASSLLRVNRGVATTGNPGTAASNGLTVGALATGGNPSNITVSEILIFSAAHDKATQDRVIQCLGRKWGIAV